MTILVAVLKSIYGVNSDMPEAVVVSDGDNTRWFFTTYAGDVEVPVNGLRAVFTERLARWTNENSGEDLKPEDVISALLYNNPFDADVLDDFTDWNEAISWAQQHVSTFNSEIGVTGS